MDTKFSCRRRPAKLRMPRSTDSVLAGNGQASSVPVGRVLAGRVLAGSILASCSVLLMSTPGVAQLALSPSQTQPVQQPQPTTPQPTRQTMPFRISAFQTPNRGMPGRRAGGGTRGDDCIQGSVPFLLALLPRTNLGLTTHAYPSFFWYLPQTTAQQAEFQLHQVDAEGQPQALIYEATLPIAGGNKIASLTLPQQTDIAPLTVGQDYQWSLAMICDPNNRDRDLRVEGWVHRVANVPEATPLQAVNPYDQASHYAEQGIWFDALETLHSLRCQQPQDEALADSWESFLASVGLRPVAQQPFSQPCRLTALDSQGEPTSSLK